MTNNEVLSTPKLVGHSAAAEYTSENSRATIHRVAELGAPWVEFDDQLCRDGVSTTIGTVL